MGITSHFANIEDTTNPTYAQSQLQRFHQIALELKQTHASYSSSPLLHMANSAASILWPNQIMDLARIGISAYGHWPSKETQILARYQHIDLHLQPALTWKTRLAQIKPVPQGAKIGYGCTYTTLRPSIIGVVPVGYHEGYDRKISNVGHVLIQGQRAPVRGRICMNMMMVDLTDLSNIHSLKRGDEVVLLGKQDDEEITAELLASWAQTIQYEMLSRIPIHVPRISI
jgi:alanine racemase